ncbi:MAG: DNA-directed DNA polymerase [Candidatus Aenigmarchaeota archaeon]|nr:DNA-directed DNA polymerase [Candidatus Aenigmarchaeota archaeon]MDW8149422.1 DNA-directed DNA polymerase [Candidatus Aenigmarchaeota archaeon]
MEVTFQVFDIDYVYLETEKVPILRIFGKKKDGKTVCAIYKKFYPYFYINSTDEKVLKNINFLKYEIVEKFLPIGYKEEKTKLIKVYLHNPADVPAVREKIKVETFEADILFKYRFAADLKINGMGWIKIEGKRINVNSIYVNEIYEAETIEPIDENENAPFKILTLDIECLGTPHLEQGANFEIIIISLFFYPEYKGKNSLILTSKLIKNSDADVICFESEKEMLEKLLEILREFDPDFIVGYNINDFDIPYLINRIKKLNIKPLLGRAEIKSASTKKLGENKYKNHILGRFIIDSYRIIKELVKRGFFSKLKRFDLNSVAKALLGESKIDISHSEIEKYWYENPNKLIEYARKDSELAFKLFLKYKVLDKYIALSRVSGLLLQDILDGGEASKIEFLLLRELNKHDFIIPNKPNKSVKEVREKDKESRGLVGGLVFTPKIGFYDKCVVYLDFASMYPNIIISLNICPTTIVFENNNIRFVDKSVREGIYPKILKRMIEERNKIKNLMKKEKDESIKEKLDAMQEAFKRIANAFYGYTGFTSGRLYILEIANYITSTGRKLITEMKELIESNTNYKVIYGDTDSLMVKLDTEDVKVAFEKARELENIVNSRYENLKMKVENIFKTLIIVTKKRYVGLSIDESGNEKIVMKGIETVRRDWCDLVTETLEEIVSIILKEKDIEKAVSKFKEVSKNLREGKIPIEKLIITKGVSKTDYKGIQPHIELIKKMKERGEKRIPGVGDRVNFVIVKGTEILSKRAEDPQYVVKNGLEIDYDYYIKTQLYPPIERIMSAIGANVSDIKDIGRQISLIKIINENNKKEIKEFLNKFDEIICKKCEKEYKTITLSCKCIYCDGDLYFLNNNSLSKKVVFNTSLS